MLIIFSGVRRGECGWSGICGGGIEGEDAKDAKSSKVLVTLLNRNDPIYSGN